MKYGRSFKYQKIIIPKGVVDPNETTVIEIPRSLKNAPVVIAMRRIDDMSTSAKDASHKKVLFERYSSDELSYSQFRNRDGYPTSTAYKLSDDDLPSQEHDFDRSTSTRINER